MYHMTWKNNIQALECRYLAFKRNLIEKNIYFISIQILKVKVLNITINILVFTKPKKETLYFYKLSFCCLCLSLFFPHISHMTCGSELDIWVHLLATIPKGIWLGVRWTDVLCFMSWAKWSQWHQPGICLSWPIFLWMMIRYEK